MKRLDLIKSYLGEDRNLEKLLNHLMDDLREKADDEARQSAQSLIDRAERSVAEAEVRLEKALSDKSSAERLQARIENQLTVSQNRVKGMENQLDKLEEKLTSLKKELKEAREDGKTLAALERERTKELEKELVRVKALPAQVIERYRPVPSFKATPFRNSDGSIREVILTPIGDTNGRLQ